MIINLGDNSTDAGISKLELFERVSTAFLTAYDSAIPVDALAAAFLEDASIFREFKYWLSSKYNVSCRWFNVGKDTSDFYIFGVEFTEDENFTQLLLQLPEVSL